jgi:predicted  nucleic acid-binding Zn-ribbon protein
MSLDDERRRIEDILRHLERRIDDHEQRIESTDVRLKDMETIPATLRALRGDVQSITKALERIEPVVNETHDSRTARRVIREVVRDWSLFIGGLIVVAGAVAWFIKTSITLTSTG